MIRKRVNTDLFLRLSIVMKDGSPANFTGAENMRVVVWHSLYTNIRSNQDFSVAENVISLQFSSDENRNTGKYGVSVFWSKPDPESETGRRDYAVDFTEAFTIVPYSEQEDDGTIEYTGKVNQNPDGISTGGDVDLSDYYNKKEVDDKLKKKIDAVEGKGLSECDFTKEDKEKLSGLSNYDDTDLKKEIAEKASTASVYTKKEVDDKLLASLSLVTTEEQEVGILRYGGKDYTIYELTTELTGLPTAVGESVDVVLSDQPCGNDLYLKVEYLSVSSGKSFPVSAYEVKRVYIDDVGNTVATIACKETITNEPKALLTIRYVKGLLSFDTFELSIPLSELGITSTDELTVEIPSLKYDKKMAFSYAMDDGKAGVYNYFFEYCKEHNLCSTDGCGNNVLFSFGSAWTTFNYSNVDLHNNPAQTNGMLWSNMIKMFDFGGGCYNHGGGVYDDPNKPNKTEDMARQSLDDNALAIQSKLGVYPFCIVVPGGSLEYRQPFLNLIPTYDTLYDSSSSQFQPNVFDVSTIDLVSQFQHGRLNYDVYFTEGNLSGLKTLMQNAYNAYTNTIYYAFSHSPGRIDLEEDQLIATNTVQPLLDWIYQNYGKGGDDKIWVTSYDDIYEYLFSRKHSVVSKSVVGSNLVLKIKLATLPSFTKHDLSLVFKKNSGAFTVSTIVSPDSVTGLSFANRDDNTLMINVSTGKRRIDLAEKYTGIYELTLGDEAKEDALYMIGRLKNSLQQPYLDRINAEASAPVLNSIRINEGEASTIERNVVIHFDLAGAITHYRIGETQDLSSQPWLAGSLKSQNYTLSSGLGDKNVFAQIKNSVGESEIKSSKIILQEKPAITYTVTGKSNNNEYGTVTPATQEVSEGGSANLTATANDGYIIESWTGVTIGTGVGSNTGTGTIANVQSDASVTCNFKSSTPPTPSGMKIIIFPGIKREVVTLPNGDKATRTRGGFSTVSTEDEVVDTAGNVVASKALVQANLPEGVLNMATSDSSNPILSGNSGVYPDEYINSLHGVFDKGVYPQARGIYRLQNMPTGTYTVKVLYSTQKVLTSAQITGLSYECNGILVSPSSGFNPLNNNNQFVEAPNVVVGSDGLLDIYMGNTQPWVRSGWNAIEIEKIN